MVAFTVLLLLLVPICHRVVGSSQLLSEVDELSQILDIRTQNDSIVSHMHKFHPAFQFYGTERTRRCLTGRKLLLLGDSTMTETLDDIVFLLSGIANDSQLMNSFTANLTDATLGHFPYARMDLPGNITTEYLTGGRRNATVTCPSIDLHIKLRFIGHWNLPKNFMGIATLSHPFFKVPLDCLLGAPSSGCEQPTDIVINSGLHDIEDKTTQKDPHIFSSKLEAFLRRLSTDFNHSNDHNTTTPTPAGSSPRIFWKSAMQTAHTIKTKPLLVELDAAAAKITHRFNITYVNVTDAYDVVVHTLPQDIIDHHVTTDGIHIGTIARDKFRREKAYMKPSTWHNMALSSLATQYLLQALCSHVA
jgi:hypothetical protein